MTDTALSIEVPAPVETRSAIVVIQPASAAPYPGACQIGLPDLTARLVADHRPERIIAPLMALGFDILDVGRRLQVLGYRGELLVETGPLPDLRAVEAELARDLPGLTVRLTIRV